MHRIGIRREDKNLFERRVPLTPGDVRSLVDGGVPFTLQPAPRRIFTDEEYLDAGAQISDDLSDCTVVLGVKEIPPERLEPSRTYLFFSHTIKGQPYNMPMLQRLMALGCTLLDYELIVDEQGRRQVFFGRHAGLAGMIDALWALGQRLAHEGVETPLRDLRQAHGYDSLEQARTAIRDAGQRLLGDGLPPELTPLVAGFAGYGNVSLGAQEIYDLLDPVELSPEELSRVPRDERNRCYKVVFKEEHLVEPTAGSGFQLQHYYDHPEQYRPVFAERYLEPLTLLINCIFWEPRYPRLVTLNDLRQLFGRPAPRLRVIGDISCDIDGSIEATVKATEPDNPVFVYDVDRGQAVDGVAGHGPIVLAVDNLPAELPRNASRWFSRSLMPLVPALARADYRASSVEKTGLPPELARAMIVHRGALTPRFSHLEEHLLRHT